MLTVDVLNPGSYSRRMVVDRQTPAYFIKLGRNGCWEDESLRDGTIRFGYRETPHELAIAGDWDGVKDFWEEIRKDAGTATRDAQQIRLFYESGPDTVFITFHGGVMYWCQPQGPVQVLEDGSRIRQTANGWSDTTLGGTKLVSERLSGHLLKVQMFRGTICRVKARDYLIRKLNDQLLPEVLAADEAEQQLQDAIVRLMRLLTWQDFELLVDLAFTSSGWRRVNVLGRTQKMVDLELWLPTLEHRAFVQVKSQTTAVEIRKYIDDFSTSAYDRMFFVWHTGDIDEEIADENVTLLGPTQFARLVMETGLSFWLKDKVS